MRADACVDSPANGQPATRAMTSSSSQPTRFAAYFPAQPTSSSVAVSSGPFIHGLTSPPNTDSPSDSRIDSGKASVSESPAPLSHGAATPIPTPPTHTGVQTKTVDISTFVKRTWKLVHDPELHPKGSTGRSKQREIRQSGQGVDFPSGID